MGIALMFSGSAFVAIWPLYLQAPPMLAWDTGVLDEPMPFASLVYVTVIVI